MDYNFVNSTSKPTRSNKLTPLLALLKRFLPVFMLSLILPFFVVFTLTPPQVGFFTRADANLELRVWIEPATVVVTPGGTADVKIIALLDSENKLIPTIDITPNLANGLTTDKKTVSFKTPFKGQVVVGTLKVRTSRAGTYEISVPKENIKLTAFEGSLDIITSPGKIIVK